MDKQGNDRDDARAVSRTLLGEQEAFTVIVRRYQGPIFRLMLRYAKDEDVAGEMAQEAFVRAFERLASYDPKRRFFTWFYTLALNLARDHARRAGREPITHRNLDRNHAGRRDDPLARLETARLLDALRGLPSKYGEALAMRYIENMAMDEVAETLGLSLSGAKMRVHRALRLLRERYGEDQ